MEDIMEGRWNKREARRGRRCLAIILEFKSEGNKTKIKL
jgi:hypothetical protein